MINHYKANEHLINIVHVPYAIASGTNSYAVSIPSVETLIEGVSVKVKFTSENTGACTLNINGFGAKSIQKSNGGALSSGNIKANQIVHLAYTGSSFQLLGEGGEYGDAQASDVLSPKTIGTESGIITGTIPNRGAPAQTLTTQGGRYNIPAGYYSGGSVTASFANLSAGNIRSGVSVGGVRGNSVALANVSGYLSLDNDNSNSIYGGEKRTFYFGSDNIILLGGRDRFLTSPVVEGRPEFLMIMAKGGVPNVIRTGYGIYRGGVDSYTNTSVTIKATDRGVIYCYRMGIR